MLYDKSGNLLVADQADIEPLTREEIIVFSQMHEIAQRRKIELRCMKCGGSFTGHNNDSTAVLSVQCKCRELRYAR